MMSPTCINQDVEWNKKKYRFTSDGEAQQLRPMAVFITRDVPIYIITILLW